jgi:hypothetical protein
VVASGSDTVRRMSYPFEESTLHRRSQSLPSSSALIPSVASSAESSKKTTDQMTDDLAHPPNSTSTEDASSEPVTLIKDVEMAKEDQSIDKASARIEEIKRQAELNRKEKDNPSEIDVHAINWDESEDDEDDDPLGNILTNSTQPLNFSKGSSINPSEKYASILQFEAKLRFQRRSPHTESIPTDSEFGSSLTDISENSPRISRKSKTKPKSAHRKGPNESQGRLKQPGSDSFNMPSSLADILVDDSIRESRVEDRKRAELLKKVHKDMEEMNRKHFDDGEAGTHPKFDPSITQVAFGEKDAKKVNEALAFDPDNATDIHSWRPFWIDTSRDHDHMTMEIDVRGHLITVTFH